MKKQIGFIRWYDESGDDGSLTDFEGKEYYFNSWSFLKTHYQVTGKCKKTGKQKTISTRLYPGLFLDHQVVKDPVCQKLVNAMPVEFVQASGIEQRWAVKIALRPDLKHEVLSYVLLCILESIEATKDDFKSNWHEHYEKRLLNFLEIEA